MFGTDRVFQNVEILKSTGQILGEIDVLVIFGNRVIVLQAKSKKLTLEARKGNDRQLQEDFKKAVQDAVDQSFKCAELLGDQSITLRCPNGNNISLAETPQTIFPITIVSDHYPALAFQARQFLQSRFNERVVSPLVTDVFALDTISEMLASPLRFLSYLGLRARHGDKLLANHEHVLLSFHLKQNLWLESNLGLVMVADDVSAGLDVAMAVRREGIPGAATPDGILTRFEGTPFSRIIAEIEDKSETAAIDLGFMLLELGEDTVRAINEHISGVIQRTAADGELHDAVIGISEARTGLTVHCSRMPDREAEDTLRQHCEIRKYLQKANSWFGLALRLDGSIRIVAELLEDWKFDRRMETLMMKLEQRKVRNMTQKSKIGRNDPCPCGSGEKYKRCCINR